VLQVICFSKDRPLHLHGYLTSFFKHFSGQAQVKVLVQSQPKWFADAYAEVEAQFPQVEWRHEQNFGEDLKSLIDGGTEHAMFGCDDVVFTGTFSVPENGVRDCIGISLRLGNHITRDMFGAPMPQPEEIRHRPQWSVLGAIGDWGYPWEVLGTIYDTDFVRRVVARVQANSPSQLEERGSRIWSEETHRRTLMSYTQSRLVVPTVNLVQQEFPNGICGEKPLDVGFLLECWNHGMRLDFMRYDNMAPESWRIPDFYLTRSA